MALNELIGSKEEPPSSMVAWVWLELMAPYAGIEMGENILSRAFSSLMTSYFVGVQPRISIEDLLEIQVADINFNDLSIEEIQEILSNEFVQKYLNSIRGVQFARSPEIRKYLKEP